MAVINLREEELVKTIDADHIPARFWRLAARDMELLGLGSELELLAKRRYAEAIAVCERAALSAAPTREQPASAGEPVAWRSRYTMAAGRLSDWHYVDTFVPVASPSTGYEVQALYAAPTCDCGPKCMHAWSGHDSILGAVCIHCGAREKK